MEVIEITQNNFEEEVKKSKGPVLVDFWATWCGPCRMQAPVIDEIAGEREDIKVGKINIDEEQPLAMEYGVTSIPTLVLFKDGKAAKILVGMRSKSQIIQEMGL